jgi:hypothetical protein
MENRAQANGNNHGPGSPLVSFAIALTDSAG